MGCWKEASWQQHLPGQSPDCSSAQLRTPQPSKPYISSLPQISVLAVTLQLQLTWCIQEQWATAGWAEQPLLCFLLPTLQWQSFPCRASSERSWCKVVLWNLQFPAMSSGLPLLHAVCAHWRVDSAVRRDSSFNSALEKRLQVHAGLYFPAFCMYKQTKVFAHFYQKTWFPSWDFWHFQIWAKYAVTHLTGWVVTIISFTKWTENTHFLKMQPNCWIPLPLHRFPWASLKDSKHQAHI